MIKGETDEIERVRDLTKIVVTFTVFFVSVFLSTFIYIIYEL